MGKKIRVFLNGLVNSLNLGGYNNIVSSTKEIGEYASRINTKRKRNQTRINKVINDGSTEKKS